jgi:hypothetical protein
MRRTGSALATECIAHGSASKPNGNIPQADALSATTNAATICLVARRDPCFMRTLYARPSGAGCTDASVQPTREGRSTRD